MHPCSWSHCSLQSDHMRHIYWHNCQLCVHEVIGMWHLKGIFVSDTYLAIIYKVSVAVCCVLVDKGKYGVFIGPFSTMAIWPIFAMWQPYLYHNVSRDMIWNTIRWMYKKSWTFIVQVSWETVLKLVNLIVLLKS